MLVMPEETTARAGTHRDPSEDRVRSGGGPVGDPPFGSVLVDGAGAVIERARNTTASTGDLAGHPEMALARLAGRRLTRAEAAAATLYTSCEPCRPCRTKLDRRSATSTARAP